MMKAIPIRLAICACAALGGCATASDYNAEDAATARRLMEEHCLVGRARTGNNPTTTLYKREGVVNKRANGFILVHKQAMHAGNITVYSVKTLKENWVAVDASSQRVRDNFYFNRKTGEFACSTDEWWDNGGTAFETRDFEASPLVNPSIGRVE